MGRWGCWLAVAVHVVVGGKEAMRDYRDDQRLIVKHIVSTYKGIV